MNIGVYVFVKRGEANGVFAVIQKVDPRVEKHEEFDEQNILETFRYDREKMLYGPGVPESNPSEDPNTVEFYYLPTMEKQALYDTGLPARMSGGYDVIDAFVCLGSRFDLKPLRVFVEVCRSYCGTGGYWANRYWANVYYVYDAQVPACIIEVECHILA